MNTKEKIISFEKKGKASSITVTHITVRQSIFFLVLKLLFLEAVAAGSIIAFHLALSNYATMYSLNISFFNIPIFVLLVLLQTVFMIYVIVNWLEEYYEITPMEVIHRKGFLFRKEERYILDHVGSITLEQGLLGRIFNFGSLKLFDWALEENIHIYLIHSPLKYHHILETLVPEADREKNVFRERVIDEEEI